MKNFNKCLLISALALFISTFSSCAKTNAQEKDIVILYTNDVHGHFGEDNKLSYKHVSQIKKDLINNGHEVLLMDAGDHLSGSLNAVYDHGETVKNLMNEAGYDVASFGNHEFDNDFFRLEEIMQSTKYEYLCTNLYHANSEHKPTTRFTKPSKVFKFKNCKLGVIGVLTPSTVSDSTPEFFKDYYFKAGEELYEDVQNEVDHLKNEGCDIVIALTHLGSELGEDSNPSCSKALIEHTNHIDALIDGHTHLYTPKWIVKNKDGQDVIMSQTGSYFDHIGYMSIAPNGNTYKIDTKMIQEYPNVDEKVAKIEKDYLDKIEEEFGKKIAFTHNDFWKSETGEDTNLAELCSDAFYYCANDVVENGADVAFVNRGGIRDYINNEDITIKKCRQIFSFDNAFVVAEVKGKTLWQGIEYAMRSYPEYAGGAMIPAGLKCDIDCSKHAEFTFDTSGGWVSGPNTNEHRVDNIKIYNPETSSWDDLEMENTYKVAGSSYIFRDGGDGLNMFGPNNPDHNIIFQDESYYDYMCLVNYMEAFTKDGEYPNIQTNNSPLNKTNYLIDYENHYGANRYNFINLPE